MAYDDKSDPSLTSMGIKRKQMYPSDSIAKPASEKDYQNEIVYPSFDVTGKQAEMMGAADLEAGEYVKQTVIWKVKSREKKEADGKTEYRMTLELCKGSDLEECKDCEDDEEDEKDGGDDEAAEGESDDDGDEVSPGLAFILGGKGAKAAG